jgi:hypothetical protein
MISPLGRDINVQMCRIVSADVTNSFEIFNVTEMDELRRAFEATSAIPDDTAGLIKRNKKFLLWLAIGIWCRSKFVRRCDPGLAPPETRAKNCCYECLRFQYALRVLIEFNVDKQLVEKLKPKTLLNFSPEA